MSSDIASSIIKELRFEVRILNAVIDGLVRQNSLLKEELVTKSNHKNETEYRKETRRKSRKPSGKPAKGKRRA